MEIDISVLFVQVTVLVLMIFPGLLLAKFGLADSPLGKGLSNIVLYAAQSAMIVSGYLFTPYDPTILGGMLAVLLLAVIAHLLSFLLGSIIFRKAPEQKRRVLIFATIFSNAGYMGIPLLKAVFGNQIAIYGSVYVFVFNLFVWSIGAYIYTGQRRYISVKKMLLNPATVSAFVGIFFFVLSAFGWNPFLLFPDGFSGNGIPGVIVEILRKLINALDALVAPLAMMVIGLQLAKVDFRHIFKDKWLYFYLLFAMIGTPIIIWLICKLLSITGIYTDPTVSNMLLLSVAAPAATATSMFAEKYDGDTAYAGVIVSVSSIICLGTMLAVSLLSYL